jgi:predicted RND superfamily exporter protein
MAEGQHSARGYRVFEWINRNIKALSIVIIVVAVVLGVVGPMAASEDQPSFNSGGEIYDTDELVVDRFDSDSPFRGASFFVETDDVTATPDPRVHDVLTAAALREFKANADAVRSRYSSGDEAALVTVFDNDLGVEIDGIFSIADAVDDVLPGGLATATDADVKVALSNLLDDTAPTVGLRFTLSRLATRELRTVETGSIEVWRAPAFIAQVRYDVDAFEGGVEVDGFEGTSNLDAERWLRDVQVELRGDGNETSVLGIAIDGGLVGEEQFEEAAPFIFLAVAFIVLLVGALLRSYWAAMLAAIGLSIVMMSYNGINSLIGIKIESPLIIFVAPIALISFGIDFFIHGAGRAREVQVEGYPRERAYPLGATALFTALLLAAASSVAAFLSNATSGIEAITQFGFAAAISITLSYLVLGLVSPRQLLAVEEALGPRPEDHGLHIWRRLGFVGAAIVGGMVVTLSIVMPAIGAPMFLVVLVGLLFLLPYRLTKRRNAKAAAAGKPMTDAVKGAGHGFTAAGSIVHFLARWRVFTVPVVGVLAIAGLWAFFQVESQFEIKDFFSSKTDFVKSLDKLETHLGSSAAGNAYVYVEGDLTEPGAIIAMEATLADLEAADAAGEIEVLRDFNGELEHAPNAMTLVRLVMATDDARTAVSAASGATLTDGDGDGLPDSPGDVGAIYDYIHSNGVPGSGGVTLYRPDQVQGSLYVSGDTQGTRVEVLVPSVVDDPNVLAVRALLDEEREDLASAFASLGTPPDLLSVSGGGIVAQDELSGFTEAMQFSLPVAVLLTFILALIVMRSWLYAGITMVPIVLVVFWIYGFMLLADYKINVITATIAAIAIGVGIDYATHFTVRFREELRGEPSRFPALRRAGVGTGGALALSALTSMTGFLVMATAPMPMFATFGVLTAVMIIFALLVSLLVLPSLLLLVTPSLKGEERARLEEAITGGEFAYDPHARETAELRHPAEEEREQESGGNEGA